MFDIVLDVFSSILVTSISLKLNSNENMRLYLIEYPSDPCMFVVFITVILPVRMLFLITIKIKICACCFTLRWFVCHMQCLLKGQSCMLPHAVSVLCNVMQYAQSSYVIHKYSPKFHLYSIPPQVVA